MTDKPKDDKPGLRVTVIGTGRSAMETISGLDGNLGPLPGSDASKDEVATEPTITGSRGRAWLVDQEKLRALGGGKHDGQVANWVVEAPWAHPVWHSYWIALVHLRPFPGMEGGTWVYLEGATHELWVYALNPDTSRNAFIEGRESPAFMTPLNFAVQLREPGDAVAADRIKVAVEDIVEGRLNPDTDATSQWAARFGDNMLRHRPGGMQRTFRPNVVS